MALDGPRTAVVRAFRPVAAVALALLPWLWFANRGVLGWFSDVGWTVLPALAAVVVVAAGLLGLRRWWPATALAVSMLVMAPVAVVVPWLPADAGPVDQASAVRVVGANVTGRAAAADELVALAPDVLVITEMTGRLDAPLSASYPYRLWNRGGPEVAVYSRLPLRLTEPAGADLPGVRVEVTGPDGPFALYALHIPRPWYTGRGGYQVTAPEHSRLIDVLARRVAAERLPAVVVGDLNTPDRTGDYQRLLAEGGLVDAMRDGWGGPTSVGQWAPLLVRIDHVLVTSGWCGDAPSRPALERSDHRGVAVTVGRCADT